MTANKTLNTAISVVNAAVGKNRIINGNFDIWQRGTTLTTTNNVNEYSADRWRSEGYGANTVVSRQSFTGGQTDVPNNPNYYCRVALTATNSAGYWAFQQRIECPQMMRGYGTYTLSFWIRTTTGTLAAGNWYYGINDPVGGPALTTTWQKVTKTVTLSSAGSESAGYVTAYLFYLAPNSPTVSVDIAQVQLEAGRVATEFEVRPIGNELQLCQRYYEVTEESAGGATHSSNGAELTWVYRVIKRASPSINYTTTEYGGGFAGTLGARSTNANNFCFYFYTTSTGSGYIRATLTAAAEL